MSERDLAAQNDSTLDEGNEDGDESSEKDEGDEESTPEPAKPVRLPRARSAPAHIEISAFGAVPKNALRWGINRATLHGDWDTLKHGTDGVLHEDWPIDELSEANVRERWGAGTYRVSWWTATPRGGRKFICNGRIVTFEGPTQAAPPAPAAPRVAPSSGLGGFDEAIRVMSVIDDQSNQKLANLVTLVRTFNQPAPAPPAPAGITFEQLRELLREEREANTRATREAIAEALGDDDDDDDDDDGEPIVDAARAAVKPLFRGKRAWWKDVGNFLAEHPEVAKQVAPVAIGAVTTVANAVTSAMTPPPPRPRAVQQLPRVEPQAAPPPPPPAPPASAPAPVVASPVPVPVDDRNDPPAVVQAAS